MRSRPPSPSRLWLLLVVAWLATLVALAGWTLLTRAEARRQATADAHRTGLRVVQAVASDQERLIEGARQLLLGLAQRADVQTHDAASCTALFASVVQGFSGYLDVVAVTPNGEVFCAGKSHEAAARFVEPADVRRSAETGDTTLGQYRIDPVSGKATIALSAPSVDDAGVVRAVVVAGLDLSWLTRSLTEAPLGGASLSVVDHHGVILTHHPEPERSGNMLDEPIRNVILAEGEGTAEGRGLDGLPSVFVFAPLLRDAERAGEATVMIALPKKTVFRDADRLFAVHLLGLGILALLLLIAAGLGADLLMLRRPPVATRVVRRPGAGELSARAAWARTSGVGSRVRRVPEGTATALEERREEAARLAHPPSVAGENAGLTVGMPPSTTPPTSHLPGPDPARSPTHAAGGVEPRQPATLAGTPSQGGGSPPDGSYLEYWGLAEAPFDNSPNTKFLYLSPDHEQALLALMRATRQRTGCAMLTGEYGCGKTMLSRALIRRLEADRFEIGLLVNPSWDTVDFLREILYQLGVETQEKSKLELFHMLNHLFLRNLQAGRDTVIIVDEAQLVHDAVFNDLRLIMNFQTDDRSLVTVLLVGSPELGAKIRRQEHLDERIATRCHLSPLDEGHTAKYIDHRQSMAGRTQPIFTADAIRLIFDATHGVPRKINNLCDSALMIGCLSGLREIDAEVIRRVTTDTTPSPAPSPPPTGEPTELGKAVLRFDRPIKRTREGRFPPE